MFALITVDGTLTEILRHRNQKMPSPHPALSIWTFVTEMDFSALTTKKITWRRGFSLSKHRSRDSVDNKRTINWIEYGRENGKSWVEGKKGRKRAKPPNFMQKSDIRGWNYRCIASPGKAAGKEEISTIIIGYPSMSYHYIVIGYCY